MSDEVLERIERYIETNPDASVTEVLAQVGADPTKYRDTVEALLAGDDLDVDEANSDDNQTEADAEIDANAVDEEASIEGIPVDELDPDDISLEDLEEQEGTIGGGGERELMTFGGMKFLVEGANNETILNLIASSALAAEDPEAVDEDGDERMYNNVNEAIIAPEITPERWRDMKPGAKVGLTMRVAEKDGIHHLMDFPVGGQSLPQDA